MSRLPIPAEALSQHIIVLGKTRSGKSSKVRVLVEWLLEHKKRVVIISPKDDWWGLKASADGKSEGYPIVIFGGKHEDLPFNPRAGAEVAELIATGNRPCLITFARQKPADRTRFYNDFMEGLFKFHQGELYVVIDEVHNFAPKGKVFSPDAGMMIHWSNTLASEGQGQGLIMIAASQRPQKVHNDLLTSCETLIACRVIHKADRDADKDWIDGCADPEVGRQLLADLASMDRADAWVWSPEVGFGPKRITWPMFETFDSFKPNKGAAPAKLKGWADVDLDDVKSKLQAVVKEAEANDPKALKAEIARLNGELAKKAKSTLPAPAAQASKDELRVAANSGYAKGFTDGAKRGWKDCADATAARVRDLKTRVAADLEGIAKVGLSTPKFDDFAPAVPHTLAPKTAVTAVKQPKAAPEKVPHDVDDRLSGPQQTILDQLGVLEHRGVYPPSRSTLAAFCRVSSTGSGYEKNLGRLKTLGLIEYPQPGSVAFTDDGRRAAAAPDDDGEPALDFWTAVVSGPQSDILRVLADAHPAPMTREAIAAEAGVSPTGSGFEKNLGKLKTLGAVIYPQPGSVVLTENVMPS